MNLLWYIVTIIVSAINSYVIIFIITNDYYVGNEKIYGVIACIIFQIIYFHIIYMLSKLSQK